MSFSVIVKKFIQFHFYLETNNFCYIFKQHNTSATTNALINKTSTCNYNSKNYINKFSRKLKYKTTHHYIV